MTTLRDILDAAARQRTDGDLVAACLQGDEIAWDELIERYKRLIFSIPIKQGVDREDASDIFQAVCLDLVVALPSLRDPQALPQWLIRTTAHRVWKWKRRGLRGAVGDPDAANGVPDQDKLPDALLHEVQQEQALRTALDRMGPRCRQMIEALFLESPPRSYRDVAMQLGLAPGSIGFIRSRCLTKMRSELQKAGV